MEDTILPEEDSMDTSETGGKKIDLRKDLANKQFWFSRRKFINRDFFDHWPMGRGQYVENLTNVIDVDYYGQSFVDAQHMIGFDGKFDSDIVTAYANSTIDEDREAFALLANGYNSRAILGKLRDMELNQNATKERLQTLTSNKYNTAESDNWALLALSEPVVTPEQFTRVLAGEMALSNPVFVEHYMKGGNFGTDYDASIANNYGAPKVMDTKTLNSYANLVNIKDFDAIMKNIEKSAKVVLIPSSIKRDQVEVTKRKFFGPLRVMKNYIKKATNARAHALPSAYAVKYSTANTQGEQLYAVLKAMAEISVKPFIRETEILCGRGATNLPSKEEFEASKAYLERASACLIASDLCKMLANEANADTMKAMSEFFNVEALQNIGKLDQTSEIYMPLIADYHAESINSFAQDFNVSIADFAKAKGVSAETAPNFGGVLYARGVPQVTNTLGSTTLTSAELFGTSDSNEQAIEDMFNFLAPDATPSPSPAPAPVTPTPIAPEPAPVISAPVSPQSQPEKESSSQDSTQEDTGNSTETELQPETPKTPETTQKTDESTSPQTITPQPDSTEVLPAREKVKSTAYFIGEEVMRYDEFSDGTFEYKINDKLCDVADFNMFDKIANLIENQDMIYALPHDPEKYFDTATHFEKDKLYSDVYFYINGIPASYNSVHNTMSEDEVVYVNGICCTDIEFDLYKKFTVSKTFDTTMPSHEEVLARTPSRNELSQEEFDGILREMTLGVNETPYNGVFNTTEVADSTPVQQQQELIATETVQEKDTDIVSPPSETTEIHEPEQIGETEKTNETNQGEEVVEETSEKESRLRVAGGVDPINPDRPEFKPNELANIIYEQEREKALAAQKARKSKKEYFEEYQNYNKARLDLRRMANGIEEYPYADNFNTEKVQNPFVYAMDDDDYIDQIISIQEGMYSKDELDSGFETEFLEPVRIPGDAKSTGLMEKEEKTEAVAGDGIFTYDRTGLPPDFYLRPDERRNPELARKRIEQVRKMEQKRLEEKEKAIANRAKELYYQQRDEKLVQDIDARSKDLVQKQRDEELLRSLGKRAKELSTASSANEEIVDIHANDDFGSLVRKQPESVYKAVEKAEEEKTSKYKPIDGAQTSITDDWIKPVAIQNEVTENVDTTFVEVPAGAKVVMPKQKKDVYGPYMQGAVPTELSDDKVKCSSKRIKESCIDLIVEILDETSNRQFIEGVANTHNAKNSEGIEQATYLEMARQNSVENSLSSVVSSRLSQIGSAKKKDAEISTEGSTYAVVNDVCGELMKVANGLVGEVLTFREHNAPLLGDKLTITSFNQYITSLGGRESVKQSLNSKFVEPILNSHYGQYEDAWECDGIVSQQDLIH